MGNEYCAASIFESSILIESWEELAIEHEKMPKNRQKYIQKKHYKLNGHYLRDMTRNYDLYFILTLQ